jgi:DMSO/TMAO reductase YedYZ molybdopterin-dependent catalytic subunit
MFRRLSRERLALIGKIVAVVVVAGGLILLGISRGQPGAEEGGVRTDRLDITSPLSGSEDPAKIDNSSIPVTPVNELHLTGIPADVDIATYRLVIDGLVTTPLSLTYDQILKYPTVTQTVLLICPYTFWDNATWTGVTVKALLADAGVKDGATKVTFHDLDGYSKQLDLSRALQDGVYLAHTVDGQVLPKEHGFPLRLVIKGNYGFDWVKWIGHITVY